MEKLFNEFPKISTPDWEQLINKDLKGASYDKKLVWKTLEGLNFNPYYRAEDLKNLDFLESKPGEFPYLRGTKTEGNSWLVAQNIFVENLETANQKAKDIIYKGVNSLNFVFAENIAIGEKEISAVLKGINIEDVEINLTTTNNPDAIFPIIAKNFPTLKGAVSYDELSLAMFNGNFARWNEKTFAENLKIATQAPNYDLINVYVCPLANAGASAVQQLATALAVGTEYINFAKQNDFELEQIAPKMRFTFAVGASYFIEIAKFRAFRYLWSKAIEAYKPENKEVAKTKIHAITSRQNKTAYDPHVNMLRTTTEAMSAILGGVDALTVEPYDTGFAKPTDFSERIARNQQILLKEEAYLDNVADVAAGSYYIENITASLIEEAWNLFLEIENQGGYLEAVKKGFIQKQVKETAKKRKDLIAKGRKTILGTNQYPNQNEKLTKNKPVSQNTKTENQEFEVLETFREAEIFEQLRQRTEKTEKTPKVFMLTYGHPAMRKARADFAQNFFAVAGFEIINNLGFETVEDGISEAQKQNADIIVLCSADDQYLQMAKRAVEAKTQKIVVVAGSPKNMDEIKQAGIENFIHVKSNVFEELKKFQDLLLT